MKKSIITKDRYVPAEYVVISGQILQDTAKKLCKRYDMIAIGTTAGLADCVNVLGVSFQVKGPLSIERLREILIDCVEEFLAAINNNERLKPSLKEFPFTENGIEIAIFVKDTSGERIYEPEITVADAAHGFLEYDTRPKGPPGPLKLLYKETYQEAKALVGR